MINELYSKNERNYYIKESIDALWLIADATSDHRVKAEIYKYFIKLFSNATVDTAAIEKVVNDTVDDIIEKFTDAFVDEFTKEIEAEKDTAAEDQKAHEVIYSVNELESRQYDDELQCNKYSAAEIAQKLNVLSQYCDIDLSGKCDIDALVHFLESVELDTEGNVWLIVQVDEHTFKRFRMNREVAGQITM